MQYLTEDDIVAFYREAIGAPKLRYAAGLSSAVGRPQQSFGGVDAYPDIFEKCAALMHSLAENQAFIDGNKRIAWISGRVFLQINGYTLRATEKDVVALFRERIPGGITIRDLAAWIERRAETPGEDDDADRRPD
ncbi:MAG: type II toxin-antitoxin system death-on-curing family toxin [Candidatus Baltobacteraceae bacterium]